MSMSNRNFAFALIAAVTISACSSTPEDTTTDSAAGGSATDYSATDSQVDGGAVGGNYGAQDQVDPALQSLVVYFDFDKANIRPDAVATLQAHAKYLSANPGARLRVEGHADERGTREYNMALGERRAQAAAAFLATNGASASQLEIISYGEERPLALGHDESSWSQNRRAELNYTSEAP